MWKCKWALHFWIFRIIVINKNCKVFLVFLVSMFFLRYPKDKYSLCIRNKFSLDGKTLYLFGTSAFHLGIFTKSLKKAVSGINTENKEATTTICALCLKKIVLHFGWSGYAKLLMGLASCSTLCSVSSVMTWAQCCIKWLVALKTYVCRADPFLVLRLGLQSFCLQNCIVRTNDILIINKSMCAWYLHWSMPVTTSL